MEKTCLERVQDHKESRIDDLEKIFRAYQDGDEDKYSEDIGIFNEYGLCFDYVAVETFHDQKEGYFRYQISYGGPSEEFRFYCDPDLHCYRIEFWFLDWFDGAPLILFDRDLELMLEIFEDFKAMGSVENVLREATD